MAEDAQRVGGQARVGKCCQVCRLSNTLTEAGLKLSFESDQVFLGEQRNGLGDRKLHYVPQGNLYS